MDLSTIISQLHESGGIHWLLGIVMLLLSFVRIPKLELNVWGWLGKQFNSSLANDLDAITKSMSSLDEKINSVESKFDKHAKQQEEDRIHSIRDYILRCNRELNAGMYFDRESFNSLLKDNIDVYRKYCHEHNDFPNSRAEAAMENIIKIYNARYNEGYIEEVEDDKHLSEK